MTDDTIIKSMSISQAARHFARERSGYYKQWMFDRPLVISERTAHDAARLQKLMNKAIVAFVENYDTYEHLMPLETKAKAIVDIFAKKKYKIGTYRTDFVYDKNRRMRLIEITCRFALNGLFLPSVMEAVAEEYKCKHLSEVNKIDLYSEIFDYLTNRFGDSKNIYILKGEDTRNASKIYTDLLTNCGYTITDIQLDELEGALDQIDANDIIISELALEELESLSLDTIQVLSEKYVINDLRTVFLIHDKRFFAVLSNEIFLTDVFTEDEKLFFNQFSIPTYIYDDLYSDQWGIAKKNKSNWIIKHSTLGKSQKIYAGVVMSDEEWEAIFSSPDIDKMILQQWIPQSKFDGQIGEQSYQDYITGTLLYFDDNFFGFGDFRTSSHPVINVVDHRKYCSMIVNHPPNITHTENYNVF